MSFSSLSHFVTVAAYEFKWDKNDVVDCLKCKETGVGSLSCWWFKMDRRCSPNRSFSWRLV